MKSLVLTLYNQSYLNRKKLATLKRQWAKNHGFIPRNSKILTAYKKLVKSGKIKQSNKFENMLRLKRIRSLSGIIPVAVMTKPYACPGKCIYCPTQENMPKSYLDDEPAVMRAKMAGFDPYLQVKRRLSQLKVTGHSIEKIELIVMGGTFSSLPKSYQVDFIAKCFLAANNYPKSNKKTKKLTTLKQLEQLQHINETAKNRIIGITLETRPDQIDEQEIKWMRKLGATRVEIGVQSVFDDVLKKVNRGHTIKQTIKATKLLKNAGFKVCYHMMPDLPGSDIKKDFNMFKTIFTDPRFMPDMIKIYPCVVVYQAKLYDWFKKGKFIPYTDRDLINLLLKIKKIVPEWVRINRLGRDIPVGNIAAGNKLSNIRQILQKRLDKKNIKCQCIRCREIREFRIKKYELRIMNYSASDGVEYFLQYVDKQNRLYALLRLRIPSQISRGVKGLTPLRCCTPNTLKVLKNCAIIRELHTYGKSLPIPSKTTQPQRLGSFGDIQHQGLGKMLIKKAEEITKGQGINKIAVISGAGAREYYRKLDYKLKDTYMVKQFTLPSNASKNVVN